MVGLGPQQQQRALESRSIEGVIIDPPVMFVLLKKGFSKVLDIGAAVEMPVGGLTTLNKTIIAKPDQVRTRHPSAPGSERSPHWFKRKIRGVHRQDDENGSGNRNEDA